MLEIDYTLIPLTDEDRAAVDEEVARRLERGDTPPLDRGRSGRVVVLNPSPVQTVHHIPDDVRTVLRRNFVQTVEGPSHLAPARLVKDITEADEPVYVLIIELVSNFQQFGPFLGVISSLRERYPDLAVFLSGPLPRLLEVLEELLSGGEHVLGLHYGDARGSVEIDNAEELHNAVTERQDVVTFSTPFFSQLRLQLPDQEQPVAFNLDTLRQLHPTFGVGEAREVDIGRGHKEKEVILDIPIRVLRDIQFRQDRGLDFHGAVRGGFTILSRNFAKEKLEFRSVPLRTLDGLLKRVPGEEIEQVSFADSRVMRVNCFTGHVAFLMNQPADQISLEDVVGLSIRRKAVPPRPPPKTGTAARPGTYDIDGVLLPTQAHSSSDPVQDAVRRHYYGTIFRAIAEQRRKLEQYTRRLAVGAVGPLAGQILKLLRRYGLERLIDPESFHYLCDLPEHLPEAHKTPARFEAHFADLRTSLRDIAGADSSGQIRLNDITHKLPVITGWVDSEDVALADLEARDLDAAYNELNVLRQFIGQEFQRCFDVGEEDLTFFNKMEAVTKSSLLAKWLAEFRRGSYGKPLPANRDADFVFFGTPDDKARNDRQWHLPAFSCAELFSQPENKLLFSRMDYAFTVFLEEQLSLALHHAREEGPGEPSIEQVAAYLEGRHREGDEGLQRLRDTLEAINLSDSPEYRDLLKEEEEAYYARYRAFLSDQDTVAAELRQALEAFYAAYSQLESHLERVGAAVPPLPEEGAREQEVALAEAVSAAFGKAQAALLGQLQAAVQKVLGHVSTLSGHVELLGQQHQLHRQWQETVHQQRNADTAAQAGARLKERVAAAGRLKAAELGTHRNRIESQINNVQAELQGFNARWRALSVQGSKAIAAMKSGVGRVTHRFLELAEGVGQGDPALGVRQVEEMAARTAEFGHSVQNMDRKVAADMEQYEQAQRNRHKMTAQRNALLVEQAACAAAATGSVAALPEEITGVAKPVADALTRGETRLKELAARVARRRESLESLLTVDMKGELVPVREEMVRWADFAAKRSELARLGARRARLRESVGALAERQALIEAELEDLPRRVQEKFMPARKELLLRLFIPEAETRQKYFQQAIKLLGELLRMDFGAVKQDYLMRAVFRRFTANQFRRGAAIAIDPASPARGGFRNVQPALNWLLHLLEHNFNRHHPQMMDQVGLVHIRHLEPGAITAQLQDWAASGEDLPHDYLVLPGGLELKRAVELMNSKDRLFHGLPRLVLIYVGKFANTRLQEDPRLREDYFRAVRHNIVVNLDGPTVVDNPEAIALYLLNQMLGCCYDTPDIEDLPRDETSVRRLR